MLVTEGDSRGLWATAGDIWRLREAAGDSWATAGDSWQLYDTQRYIYNTINDIHVLWFLYQGIAKTGAVQTRCEGRRRQNCLHTQEDIHELQDENLSPEFDLKSFNGSKYLDPSQFSSAPFTNFWWCTPTRQQLPLDSWRCWICRSEWRHLQDLLQVPMAQLMSWMTPSVCSKCSLVQRIDQCALEVSAKLFIKNTEVLTLTQIAWFKRSLKMMPLTPLQLRELPHRSWCRSWRSNAITSVQWGLV